MASADEIREVDMEIVEMLPEEPGRVGSKRIRDSPTPLLHSNGLNKAGNVNLLDMNSHGPSKMWGQYLHGTHDLGTPDCNTLRLNISSPGENPENKTKRATKICTLYAQGRCNKGKSCTFLHEREGLGSAKAGLLAPAGSGNHRGSEEGFQLQHQSNLKVPQFKDAEGSSSHKLYRSLIDAYGEDNERSAHLADKQNSTTPWVSQGLLGTGSIDDSLTKKPTATTNELVQSLVHEKNHKPFMRHHTDLASETYLDGRGTFLDGGNFQSGMDNRNGLCDSHVSRTYLDLDVNTLNSDHQFRPFGLSISSDPLQFRERLSAYGTTTENLPNTHQKEHHSSHASYSSRSLAGFRNPSYATSEISLGNPTLRGTSQLGVQSHLFTTGIEKVNLHIDVDKGCSPDTSIMSPGPFSPIKDEPWITSVPFVPSFSFPGSTTSPGNPSPGIPSPGSLYDPFVDCWETPKVGNISFNFSSQHTNQYVITDKSLNHDDKLTRNMSAKGPNGPAYLIASDRGRSSSLDGNNRVKACDRKIDAAGNDDKAKEFRFHLAEHIKQLIKPIWKEGNLSKDAHKLVVKKSVEKVVDSIEPNQVPNTEDLIAKYITTFGSKIAKLVKGYVDLYRTT